MTMKSGMDYFSCMYGAPFIIYLECVCESDPTFTDTPPLEARARWQSEVNKRSMDSYIFME